MRLLKEWLQTNWRLVLGGGVVVVIVLFQWLSRPAQATPQELTESGTSSVISSRATSSSGDGKGYVHIQGAVAKPGLYPVTGKTRWAAIVTMAGGFTKDADSSALNLAKIAQDQESLYVPIKGERAPATVGGGAVGATADKPQVNINTATAEELKTLSGIGPARAADIIAYREENGPFETIEGLKQVSGIGDKTFEKLADSITVGP